MSRDRLGQYANQSAYSQATYTTQDSYATANTNPTSSNNQYGGNNYGYSNTNTNPNTNSNTNTPSHNNQYNNSSYNNQNNQNTQNTSTHPQAYTQSYDNNYNSSSNNNTGYGSSNNTGYGSNNNTGYGSSNNNTGYGSNNAYGNRSYGNNNYGNNSYGNTGNTGGYGTGTGTGQGSYEMQPQKTAANFYAEIDDVKSAISTIDNNVSQIEQLHQQSLSELSDEQSRYIEERLDVLTTDTRKIQNTVAQKIKVLENKSSGNEKAQVQQVRKKFRESIQKYSTIEKVSRDRLKNKLARQYRIVNPNATQEEIAAATDGNQQVFSQALMNSNRQGEARSALREVQNRHQDILRIEKTIAELAQLFADMDVLVTQQDAVVQDIEKNASVAHTNIDQGATHTDHAVVSARGARKKKWICCFIVVLILLVVAIILVIYFLVINASTKITGGGRN